MKKTVHLILSFVLLFAGTVVAQTAALNPADVVAVYNSASPPTQPAYGRIGKWVKTTRLSWNTSGYKAYIYKGMQFRLKFPKTYLPGVSDGKKYPIFVFLHGRGEGGSIYDNEYQLLHGGSVFNTQTDNGNFDGYLLYAQTTDGNWGIPQYDNIKELLDTLAVQAKGDLNRVAVNGLSAGGYGSWEIAGRYPQSFAGIMPMSGITTAQGAAANIDKIKFSTIWYFQGGLDGSPSPYTANVAVAAMQSAGANIKYTLYPDLGHGTWDRAWSEADFIPFLNRINTLTPWPLTGRAEFCPGETFTITVGIAPGFSGYEWQKDGSTIPGATANQITVTALGTYAVRVLRGSTWSEWSPNPLVVKTKTPTVTPPITIDDTVSSVLPAPDGSTTAVLKLPTGYASYEWRAVGGTTALSTTNTLTAGIGQYIARVTELYGCASSFSEPFNVINSAGTNVPDAAGGLTLTPVSQTQLTLNWTDKANPQYNETAFEIYRSTTSGSGYKLITKIPADVLVFQDAGLVANQKYYYIIRAINGNGAAPLSPEASGTTQIDAISPTAPQDLKVTGATSSSISLSWTASTDNVAVTGYDVYVNNVKAYTVDATSTTMVAYGLTERSVYNFYVVAKDAGGNNSTPSNQVTAAAINKGLIYRYYEGTYSVLPNFSTLTPIASDRSANVDISVRKRDTYYAMTWTGFLRIPVAGTYTFATTSDDGSKLYFNTAYSYTGTATVNNDGGHGATQVASTARTLAAGLYPIVITYFQAGGSQSMSVQWMSTAMGVTTLTNIPDQYFGDTLTIPGAAPATPLAIGANAASFKKVNVSWADNSSNETGFEIYRSPAYNGTFSVIGKANANTTSFEDNTVSAASRYYYKVRAIGLYGESAISSSYPYLAVYPFNNSYEDISLNNNTASGTGITFSSVEKVEGSYSATLNGTSSYVSIGGSTTGFLHDAFTDRTVSLWIKAAALDNTRTIFDIGGSDNGVALRINANKLEAGVASGSVRTSVSAAFTSTAWTNVVVVYNSGALRLYINGTLAASATTSFTSVGTTTNNSRIGFNNGTNAFNVTGVYYSGNIDNFSIIGQALTQAQITQLASQSLPFYSTLTPALPAAPTAPVNVVAAETSPSSTKVTWTNNTTNTTGYEIHRAFGTSSTFVLLKTIDIASGTTVTFTDSSLYANQQYVYKIRAIGDGGTSAFSATVSTVTGNNRPIIEDIRNQSARFDVETHIPVVASDVDGDLLTYTTFNLPAFVTLVNDATGVYLKVAPNVSLQGTYNNLSVIAADPFGGKDTTVFNLTINDNYSPVIASIANASLNEGDDQQLLLAATDQNTSDTLTWSAVSLPSFILLTGNNRSATLRIKPGYADAGVYTIKIEVVDNKGGTDSKSFTLIVNDKDPNYKYYLRFKYMTDAPAPWNNITGLSTYNLKNDKGETTTANLLFQNVSWYSWNEGAVTGNNSGIYPDAVLKEYFFFGSYPGIFTSSNSVDVKLTGLETNRKYSFKFFAGSAWSVQANNGTTIFTVNGVSKPLAVQGNTSNTVNFDNIAPNASGEITFNISVPTGTLVGYMNAIEVNAILDDGTLPAAPKDLTASQTNGNVSLNWTNVAYNATGYRIHRATDSLGTYSLLGSLTSATATAYVDSSVHGNTYYYYKISASNTAGVSGYSNIAGVNVPVKPPRINNITNLTLKAGTTAQFNVQAQGDLGNTVTLTVQGLPSFGIFTNNGSGTGSFSFAPTTNHLGKYDVTLTATDNQGAVSATTFTVTVSDKNTNSVYINFASTNPAPAPWNNISGFPYAGVRLANALDESGIASGISVTFNENWENDATANGMSTYDNSGIFPDAVMQSSVYESKNITHTIKLSGLNTTKRYNVVFFSSSNFGVSANVRFTINTDSVVITPSYNTSLTKQLNRITPNSAGEINILVNKTNAGYYAFMNAMILEVYDSSLDVLNPMYLRAEATGAKSIALKWNDRANNETGYQVWRAVSGGSYTQIATLAANTVSYTDTTLAVNKKYYYKVRAVRSTVFSDYSNSAAATTVGFKIQVNFSELLSAPLPWNNTLVRPQEGLLISNMKDAQSNVTGMGINIQDNFDGMYSAGMNTGNNSGIYPDNVMVENYGLFPGRHASFNITGLNQTLKYDLVFFGSSYEWADITGKYTVNGTKMAYLNASMNKSGIVTIRDVSPDQYGNIKVDVDPASVSSNYGLIAALTVMGHLDPAQQNEAGPVVPALMARSNTEAVIAPMVSVLTNEVTDFAKASVYPNPFNQQFNIDIQLKTATAVKVEVFDLAGRLLYSDYKGSLPAGASTLRINTGSKISAPGLYLLRISGNNGETSIIKLVKQ
jgi:predicted esterase